MPRTRLAVVAVAVLLAACSSGSADDGADGADGRDDATEPAAADETAPVEETAPSLPPVAASELVEQECWWPLPDDAPEGVTATCGTVAVPSDPSDPSSAPVTLAVARFHGGGDPAAEPVLYLHGGPGGDILGEAPGGILGLDILDQRDVITFDQRGTGRSTPSLDCPEKEEAILDALAAPGTWEDEHAVNQEAVRACHRRLTEDEGIDLDQYDTPTSVRDVEVLRETFGVEAWNVWGVSYGTRLGLDYARTHPDRVRSLLIDSVYAPEAGGVERTRALPQGALDRLVAACAAEAACTAAHGDLGPALVEATAAMDADPEELTATVTVGGEEVERSFALTGTDIRAGLFAALYESELIPVLPSVVTAVAAGDRGIIPQFVDVGVPRLLDLSEGAFYSVECADSGRSLEGADVEAELAAAPEDALIALNSAQVFCADWPVEHVPETFAETVTADVPTLVFGGTLDPITPYADSEAQAGAMPDARLVTVPNAGHGVAGTDDCTRSARDGFWRDPAAALPACLEQLAAPAFVGGD